LVGWISRQELGTSQKDESRRATRKAKKWQKSKNEGRKKMSEMADGGWFWLDKWLAAANMEERSKSKSSKSKFEFEWRGKS
jgi:hypothetical protein